MHERFAKTGLLLCLAAVAGVAAAQVHSFDLFWQLQSGKELWRSGAFIRTDLFTLASSTPRWEHCWLHDLIVFAFYQAMGYAGLSLLKGALVVATCGLTVLTARRRGASWSALLAIAPFCWLLTRGGWLERPQLWSYLLFSVFLWLLIDARGAAGRRLWLLLALTVLWANLHAGAILAVPLLLAAALGAWAAILLERGPEADSRNAAWRLSWAAILALPALLGTPYGSMTLKALLAAPRLGVDSGLSAQLYNLDWSPTTWAHEPGFFILLGVAAGVLSLCWRRVVLTDLFLLAGLAAMGLKLGRHTPFFFFGVAALLPRYLDLLAQWFAVRLSARIRAGLRVAALLVSLLLFSFIYRPALVDAGFFRLGLRSWHYPVAAAEFVRSARLPTQLWNTYDWGGYLEWQLYPEYLVFWDGRQDSPEMFALGLTVMRGDPGWEAILERFAVQTIVTKTCTVDTGQHYPLIDRLRESPDWALVFAEVPALIFVRRSAVDAAWLREHEQPASRIDATILAEAQLLVAAEPRRYHGWWEIARILVARRDYAGALPALENYLRYSPQPDPRAENLYRIIAPLQPRRP